MAKKNEAVNTGMFKAFWRTIRRVPRGKVATYGDIAYAAGFPGAARQVAWALHAHGQELPWQRIVGAGGRILLTGEFGFEQRMRLEQEGVRFLGLHVEMKAHQHSFFPAKKRRVKAVGAKAASAKKAAGKKPVKGKNRATASRVKKSDFDLPPRPAKRRVRGEL